MILAVHGEVKSENDVDRYDATTLEKASAAANVDVSKNEVSSTDFNPKEPETRIKSALERRLLWKQDLVIVPLMALTYFTSWLVRAVLLLHQPRRISISDRP